VLIAARSCIGIRRVVFYGGDIEKQIVSGQNSMREAWNGCGYGLHAEMEAISHLPPQNKNARRKYIDLIVIRVDLLGNLKSSKPCAKCIEYLGKIRNYKIGNVYYSNEYGHIISIKFSRLSCSKEKHFSKRFRNK
jgi:hypothetical protein